MGGVLTIWSTGRLLVQFPMVTLCLLLKTLMLPIQDPTKAAICLAQRKKANACKLTLHTILALAPLAQLPTQRTCGWHNNTTLTNNPWTTLTRNGMSMDRSNCSAKSLDCKQLATALLTWQWGPCTGTKKRHKPRPV